MSGSLLPAVGQTPNFVHSEILGYFIGTIACNLSQTKVHLASDLSKFLVRLYHQPSIYNCLCVYSTEICVDICFNLLYTKIYIFLPFIVPQLCYWKGEANLPRLHEQEHLHFIMLEVTWNILSCELDMMYMFYISRVCLFEIFFFFFFNLFYNHAENTN